MKTYYATAEELREAKGVKASAVFSFEMQSPINTGVFFVDDEHTIYTEQWNLEGRFRGWCEEILSKEEYFKRKLAGK